jgi:hypothetical protein
MSSSCAVCKLSVTKKKAPGVQCGGSCKQFFHFDKCAKLTTEECDLIESNRLVYVCPACKKKRASIIFPRRDSVSEFEENAKNMPLEKLLEAQKELRDDVQKLTGIIEEMQKKISVFDSVISRFEKVADNLEKKPPQTSEKKSFKNQKVSYASIVQSNKPVVIVKPKNIEQLGAETINQIKSVFDPVENNIKGVKSVSKGGVVITCNDLESTNKCREEIAVKLGDEYEVNVSKQKKPLLKIWGLSEIIEKEEFVQRLRKQNECVTESACVNVVCIKKNPRGVMCLLEADQQTHESLLSAGRVLIGWDSCRVYQHIDILRCFHCSQFGHIAANCRNQLCCAKCCGDHEGIDCESEDVKCANCVGANERLKLNLDVNHPSFSLKCPSYKRKVQMLTKNYNANK